jgi:hypothetical protein
MDALRAIVDDRGVAAGVEALQLAGLWWGPAIVARMQQIGIDEIDLEAALLKPSEGSV